MPKREHYLFVCTNRRAEGHPKGSCAASGSEAVHSALKSAISERGLARTGIRACTSSCLDTCHMGPTIAVLPEGWFYGKVTVDDVPEIVESLAQGKPVERLLIPNDQFDEPPKQK
jgi:(2Fe-2S) ferredoxin